MSVSFRFNRIFAALAAFSLALALCGCRPAPDEGKPSGGDGQAKSDSAANTGALAPDKFDWTTIHYRRPVTVIHKWQEGARVPPIAAVNATGSRIVYADASDKLAGGSAVWLVDLPGGEKRKLFDVEGAVFDLLLADTGDVLFSVSIQGGQLYSISEGAVWARVDYDDCKEAAALGPGGTTMTCWGGGTQTLRHYSKTFNLLSVIPFWGEPLPAVATDIYSGKSVIFLPAFGVTQIILQLGTKQNPQFTFLSLNTSQKVYGRHSQLTYAYLVGGALSKTGEIYRCLLAPSENWAGRNPKGRVPLTHRLVFQTADMSYRSEPIKPISEIPYAIDRLAENALVDGPDGSLKVVRLGDGETAASVPGQHLERFKFLGAAGDLGGFAAMCGNELRWFDLDRFAVKSAN